MLGGLSQEILFKKRFKKKRKNKRLLGMVSVCATRTCTPKCKTRIQGTISGAAPHHSHCLWPLRQALPLKLELGWRSGCSEILYFPTALGSWDYGATAIFFRGRLGFELKSSCWCSEWPYPPSHHPSPTHEP